MPKRHLSAVFAQMAVASIVKKFTRSSFMAATLPMTSSGIPPIERSGFCV